MPASYTDWTSPPVIGQLPHAPHPSSTSVDLPQVSWMRSGRGFGRVTQARSHDQMATNIGQRSIARELNRYSGRVLPFREYDLGTSRSRSTISLSRDASTDSAM